MKKKKDGGFGKTVVMYVNHLIRKALMKKHYKNF